jgi:hypothetical protein
MIEMIFSHSRELPLVDRRTDETAIDKYEEARI